MQANRTTVASMIPWVAPNVQDSGICPDTPEGKQRIIEDIDLGTEMLLNRIDVDGAMFEWRVPVEAGCFALPQDCLEARQLTLNGVPLTQRTDWYLGKVCPAGRGNGCCGPMECIDLGDFAIPTPLPKNRSLRIALVAEDPSDAGVECVIEVINQYGERKQETLTLLANQQPVITESDAVDVTFFQKPRTQGAVSMQIATDANGQRLYLCSIDAKTEQSQWRRKQLPRQFWGCNILRIVGKIRYIRLQDENDIMPIDNRIAMGLATQAVAAWRRKDLEYMAQALNAASFELFKQMQNADSASNVRQVKWRNNFANPSQAGGRRCWN